MRTLTTIPTPQQTNPPPTTRTPRPRTQARQVKHSTWGRVRHAAAEIAPETIEHIAQRVAQLLRHDPQLIDEGANTQPYLMNAGQLAKHLGLTRAWVYEHANQLGAIPISDGPKPRLRFDLQVAKQALDAHRRRRQPEPPQTNRPRPGRPRRHPATSTMPLLPVHEPRSRGIVSRLRGARRRWY